MSNYADPIDQAAEAAEAFTNAALDAARRAQGPKLTPKGACHDCGAPLAETNQLFCDEECAEEHAYVERRRRANRRPV